MKCTFLIRSFTYIILAGITFLSPKQQLKASLPESLAIEVKNVLQWETSYEQDYQLQKSTNGTSWEDIATAGESRENQNQHEISTLESSAHYRVIKTTEGHENELAIWSAFAGSGSTVTGTNNDIFEYPSGSQWWAGFANDATGMYPLTFSNGGNIDFTASVQEGGTAHIYFRFEANVYPNVNPHFNIGESNVTWTGDRNSNNKPVGYAYKITGSTPTEYSISIPSQGNNTFNSFVWYIIERDTPVILQNVRITDDSTVAGEQEIETLSPEMVTEVSWSSLNGVEYDVMESSNLVDWYDFGTNVQGDGNTKTITMTMDQASRFIRVIRPEYELFAPSDPVAQQSLISNALTLSWNPSTTPTVIGYRVYYGPDQSNLDQSIDVPSGNSVTVTDLIPETPYYFAVVAYTNDEETDPSSAQLTATPSESITLVPLHDATTALEPETTIETDQALYTYVSDRGRGRHAREVSIPSSPALYDIYLDSYWNGRAYYFEIIDRVGKAEWVGTPLENTITINSTFQYDLAAPEMRTFYLGTGTVANYYYNYNPLGPGDSPEAGQRGHRTVDGTNVDTNSIGKYTWTFSGNPKEGRAMQLGDRMEIELSVFGLPPTNKGRSNYYGTAFLYIIGEGLKPWYAHKDLSVMFDYTYEHGEQSDLHPLPRGHLAYESDSYPLPESAWLGGLTTHHTQYSAEPKRAYKQMAYNLAPFNSQKFMDGRRLHHTDFQDGSHSEPDNDLFYTHIDKRGPDFINNSCVACHTNNGRAIPNGVDQLMTKSIIRVGSDNEATIHPDLGTVLQVKTTSQSSGLSYNEATNIYVDLADGQAPYYNFYLDEAKTIPFDFTNSGESSLVGGQTYTFIGLNAGHPFDMYYTDSNNVKTYLVDNLLASGTDQSFTLNANNNYSSYTFTYECEVHPHMAGTFNLVNASNAEKTAYRADYTEISGTYGDGTSYTLRKPNYTFSGDSPDYYSVRSAPQLVGLGLLEAIDETTIVNLSDPNDLNNDGISGRINVLNDPETGDIRLGRFGYKASKARLRHHIASALNTDMGITTSIYPTIDFKNTATSQEINDSELDLMYRYVALLALMPQRDFNDSDVIAGKALFSQANCIACHIETIQTSDYHPLTELRNQTIHPYTDLLLHDMGTGLADNMGEGLASGSEWRTAPLWNIGYTEYVSYGEAYLHDGRARNLEEAILWHGGEAEASKEAFRTMSASDRSKLITFLKSL